MAGEVLKGIGLSGHDARVQSSTQFHPLGSLAVTDDGRAYRYCRAGAALTAGNLVQDQAEVGDHRNIAVASAAAINATSVTVTLGGTAATANQYREGFLVVADNTGEGIAYKISSHPAADASASLVVTLVEPIVVALDTTSEVALLANPYFDVNAAASQALMPIGVPNIDVTSGNYFWAQTRGVVSCDGVDAYTKGQQLVPSGATAGRLDAKDADTEPIVGVSLSTAVTGEHFPVFLMLD